MSQHDLEMKFFGPFEVKDEDRGEVVAVVATLGVVDKDGDVIMPGAFPVGGSKVKLSGYSHDVITEGAAPVGKGVVYEEDGRAFFKGNFFMSTQRGREAFLTTKELGSEGEWSFGFPRAVKTGELTDDWKTKGARRIIKGLQPIEASPVFVGAGWGTGTLLTKEADAGVKNDAPVEVKEMPMPMGDEAEAAFMDRCMASEMMQGEMPDAEQRMAACRARWAEKAAKVEIQTPADAVEAEAKARREAEEAEAKATAEMKAKLEAEAAKAQRARAIAVVEEFRDVQNYLAKNLRDNDSVQQVQRALRRMGLA